MGLAIHSSQVLPLTDKRAGPMGRNIGDNSSYHTGQPPVIAFLVSLIWQTEKRSPLEKNMKSTSVNLGLRTGIQKGVFPDVSLPLSIKTFEE